MLLLHFNCKTDCYIYYTPPIIHLTSHLTSTWLPSSWCIPTMTRFGSPGKEELYETYSSDILKPHTSDLQPQQPENQIILIMRLSQIREGINVCWKSIVTQCKESGGWGRGQRASVLQNLLNFCLWKSEQH